jgi:phage-related baseplate assembly protein
VVLPATRPDLEPQPASPGFLATVNRQLQAARLVASRIVVVGADFVPVNLAAKVTLKKTAAAAQVRETIEKSLREFVNPQKWPFSRNVFPSEIHQRLAGVPEVAFASQVRINGWPAEFPLSPIQLPRLERTELEMREARDG